MIQEVRMAMIANWAQGDALSGGDRIFIEMAKRWINEPLIKVHLFVSEEGWQMCRRSGLPETEHTLWSSSKTNQWGFMINYISRTLRSLYEALRYPMEKYNLVYSASDFWPDTVPAFIMRLKNPKVKWISGFYLFAPEPWKKDSPYKGKKWFIGLFYWLTQLPIYWLIKRYADMVFVTSEPDVEKFATRKRGKDKIVAIRGGVDIKPPEEYLNSENVIPVERRKYDACFVGRLHPQKGILELIDIWQLVCGEKTDAKLAIIGTGLLEKEVKEKIEVLGLQDHIELLGFKDGNEKYEVFKQSRIIVHPATYDSGGMAACEAMAWGLPGVSFDLEALKTYYPKGMIKIPCYDLKGFAINILRLLNDKELYEKTKADAVAWAREWDWDKKAEEILKAFQSRLF